MADSEAEAEASFRELRRASLTPEEKTIAQAAGFSVDSAPQPCELRSRRAGGLALARRLNPSKYDLGRPGFPELDDDLGNSELRFDPYTCLPENKVRKGKMSYIPDPAGGRSGGPSGPLWSYNISPEDEAKARAFVKRFVEFVD